MQWRLITILIATLSAVLLSVPVTRSSAQAPRPFKVATSIARSDASMVALKNVRIIDGTGAPPKEHKTVLIEAGIIRAVGDSADVIIPSGARILDLAGCTVLPGLVMLHEHFQYRVADDLTHAQPFTAPRLFLAFGVTTVRTAGTDHPFVDLNLKREIDAGRVPGPEMFVTSPFLNGDASHLGDGNRFLGDKVVRDLEDARRAVRYWAAEGVTSFKVYRRIWKEALTAIIEEAHRLGLPVTAHLGSVGCREAVELGIDNIEHGFFECLRATADGLETDPNGARAQDLIRLLLERKVVLTFTPVNFSRPLSDRELDLLHPAARESYLRAQLAQRSAKPPASGPDLSRLRLEAQLTLAFARAGGQLVLGSDPGGAGRMPGFTNHEALKLAVKVGFTPLEAIRIATLNGATFLKVQDRTGSIAVGKEADLPVVRGDPSVSIEDIENVEEVFANGRAYDPNALISTVKGLAGWR
jgi:imidazolonepropionase-like amidohydrolase